MAAHQGNFAIVKFLIDHGADVKQPASQVNAATPLHLVRKDPEIVKLLIAKGADPNDTSDLGHTPLDSVVTDTTEDVADRLRIFNALLAGGAQVDHEQSTGATPLIDLLNSNDACFEAKDLLPMVTALVDAKANVKAEDMFHNSAQSLALEMQKDCESPEDAKAAAQLLDVINRAVQRR
jgi:ankyrin repeat protein